MLSRPNPALPLPLLITGVSGVAGYNALDYFCRRYPEPGDGHAAARQLAVGRAGDRRLQCRGSRRAGAVVRATPLSCRCSIAPATALKSCQLDPEMAWRINVEGVRNLVDVVEQYDARLVHLSVDLVYSGLGAGGHVETDPTDPVTVYGETMVAAEELILDAAAGRLHLANLAADGDQLQRPCRRDRLDRLAIQERKAGHAVLRRNPHAFLHRLLELAVRNRAGQRPGGLVSRRRAAAAELVPDRADHQSRRRLRSRSAVGMRPRRGRPDASSGGQCFARFEQAGPGARATTRSMPGPTTGALCRPIGGGISSGRPTSRARPSCLPASCIAIPVGACRGWPQCRTRKFGFSSAKRAKIACLGKLRLTLRLDGRYKPCASIGLCRSLLRGSGPIAERADSVAVERSSQSDPQVFPP